MPRKTKIDFSPSLLFQLESKYLRAYPDFNFPNDLNPEPKFKALTSSNGRKIVFVNGKDGLQFYFEDEDKKNQSELKDFKNLIGCGG